MTILVTGATGFLGGVTARTLAADGWTVRGLGRDLKKGAALEADGVRFVEADLRGADWDALLDGVEGVVHAAARSTLWGHAADFHADNVAPSAALAQACARRGVRLVHVSTPSVYNATGRTEQVREDTPVGPRFDSLYARSKWQAEQEVRAALPDATVLRPRGIYGVGDTSIVPRLAAALRAGRLPRLTAHTDSVCFVDRSEDHRSVNSTPGTRFSPARSARVESFCKHFNRSPYQEVWTDLTDVRNVAHAITLALTRPAPGVFNVTDGQAIPLWATLDRLADTLSVPRPARRVPARLLEGVAAVLELGARLHPDRPEPPLTASGVRLLTRPMTLDLTRARERLGYAPVVTPEQGFADVFAALRGGAA
ncbi:NAD-dependent epimerase/dehydratase family protein [Deinococcus xianganensis]|uniref:NAD-dependent epimerase/dehydratase family protein n=1 Tax=Deinococcus xianganensis TaxID=1507289 RepID=A0A6I4YG68_9DEIO|nr:NAD-dependent epimerase/dehydratase family protein [Deinococcus xianganensis]MXV18991.1 NAD-dependent epimerase/dehydratase family protein [Deinococcus xianganensis]